MKVPGAGGAQGPGLRPGAPRRRRPRARRLPPQGQAGAGVSTKPSTPQGNSPQGHARTRLPPAYCRRRVLSAKRRGGAQTTPPPPVPSHLSHHPNPGGTPSPRPKDSEGFRQVPPPARGAGPLELLRAELGCFRARPLRTRHWAALAGSLAAAPQSAAAAAACGPGGWEKRSVGE